MLCTYSICAERQTSRFLLCTRFAAIFNAMHHVCPSMLHLSLSANYPRNLDSHHLARRSLLRHEWELRRLSGWEFFFHAVSFGRHHSPRGRPVATVTSGKVFAGGGPPALASFSSWHRVAQQKNAMNTSVKRTMCPSQTFAFESSKPSILSSV